MNFFERQDRARRTSRLLIAAFTAAFAGVVLATTALVAAIVYFFFSGRSTPVAMSAGFVDWALGHTGLLGLVALATLGVLVAASAYRAASLAGGGGKVARMLGGTEVTHDASDLPRKRLLNVVEEMAIASGLPRPEVYVLEQEAGINAFAAGLSTSDAAIAVTRGALEQLDRTELQGVIAHEFSHIVHGDMRLNQQLIGLSFGILVLSLVGRWLLRGARFTRRGRSSGAAVVLAVGGGLLLIGSIGLLASRLIKAGVSRERERLADASAVQYTRDAGGLASALKKIAGFGGRLTGVESEEVAHMLFEHHGAAFRGWFATHPPLAERIRTLDPSFDPRTLDALARRSAAAAAGLGPDDGSAAGRVGASGRVSGLTAGAAAAGASRLDDAEALRRLGAAPAAAAASGASDSSLSVLDHAGEIGSPEVGAELLAALPAEILDAAHSRDSSLLLVLALALAPDPPTRAAQHGVLEAQLGARRAERCEALREAFEELDPALRIPILELAVPALKQRPAEQLEYMFELAGKLSECARERRLFDYVLIKMLENYFSGVIGRRAALDSERKLSASAACAALLAVVAAYGHDDAAAARAAYQAGCNAVGKRQWPEWTGPLASMRDPSRLDAALTRLDKLSPRHKQHVLAALLVTIRHDSHVGIEELELFRAVAATLGCPIPPDLDVLMRTRRADTERSTASPALSRAAD